MCGFDERPIRGATVSLYNNWRRCGSKSTGVGSVADILAILRRKDAIRIQTGIDANELARYCECWILKPDAMDLLAAHGSAAAGRARIIVRNPPRDLFRSVYKPKGTQFVACFLSATH